MNKLRLAYEVWHHFGFATAAYRARYAVSRRTGILKRRFPAGGWDARPLREWCQPDVPVDPVGYRAFHQRVPATFFFPLGRPPAPPAEVHDDVRRRADEVLTGKLRYFSQRVGALGFPFDWFVNPFTGQRADANRHWCDRDDFEADQGDIKVIWEPSRFGWAFDLARAYAVDRDDRYAAGFWALFESWHAANPPNMGPNWQCGQECALRAMACVFALYTFWEASATTAARVAAMSQFLAEHAARIEANIAFARSQRNNHALSEAAGLYTIGLLFPEFRAARRWRRLGRFVIELEARRQIAGDGSYIQQSMNYHRVMLHDLLWTLRLADLNDKQIALDTRQRVEAAAEFLYQIQDPDTGRVPNYGSNDGALILPLTSCDYLDYRPVLQTAGLLFDKRRRYGKGPWDEEALWLFGAGDLAAAQADRPRISSTQPTTGGYYVLRTAESWAFTRCHTYRTRPAQADMLHVDLWWHGVNVLRDTGSYSYNAPAPWKHHFLSTPAHNTITIDRADQMEKGPRFMWFGWTRAELRELSADPPRITTAHFGYEKRFGVTHERTIAPEAGGRVWMIRDRLSGKGRHTAALHWHFVDAPWQWLIPGRALAIQTDAGPMRLSLTIESSDAPAEVLRGVEDGQAVAGWESLYYGEKQPIPVLRWAGDVALPFEITTRIDLAPPP